MLLKITHQTDLTYSDLISETVMELRMAPRQEQDQHRLSFSLAIGPKAAVTSYFDWLGNIVHAFTVHQFHKQIQIKATSVVETDRARRDVTGLPDAWPLPPSNDYGIWDYLQFGGPVCECPALSALVEQIRPRNGESLGWVVMRLLQIIHDRFVYEKDITTASSPITEILQHGRGVCQDFTHLLIGLARAMKIPARYVSGYLFPDTLKYRGYAQTHAWCELYFPSVGWVGVDPTNRCVVGSNFVKIAVGRHYGDVPPNRGMFKGHAKESMEVNVSCEELAAIPPALASERIEALSIPLYGPNPEVLRQQIQAQEMQQQQQKQVELKQQQEQQQQ